MMMSEEEFKQILKKNPKLKIHQHESSAKKKMQPSTTTPKKQKSPKYWNVKVYIYEDGFVSELKSLPEHGRITDIFDSRREYMRYLQLEALQTIGKISSLNRQQTLLIQEAFTYENQKIAKIEYKADFAYIENGVQVIEDVKAYDEKTGKSRSTETFKLKWKLLKFRYPQYKFQIY